MQITLTKAEAKLIGESVMTGTADELSDELSQAWVVWDDAPYAWPVREKAMKTIEGCAAKHGLSIKYLVED